MVSDTVHRYLSACAAEGNGLRHLARDAVLPALFDASYRKVMLDRPIIVGRREIEAFGEDLRELFRIMTSVPERVFDGDLDRYGAAIGLDERLAAVMRIGAAGRPELYARADAYHDGTSFRLLEFNVGSELGGVDYAQLNRSFLRVEAFRAFADAHGLGYTDTLDHLVAGLRRAAAPVAADRDPVVALVEGPGGLRDHEGVFTSIREAMRGRGIDLVLGEVQDLRLRGGKLTLHGTALDVVLRYFVTSQLLEDMGDEDGVDTYEMIMRSHAERRTALFTPLDSALFTSKASLGLLHGHRVRSVLTDRERAVVDRVLPRTWTIGGAGRGDDTDAEAEFAIGRAYAAAHRASLVLKPGIGYSADGVVIGRELTDAEWRRALDATRGRDYVAQELVEPAGEPVLDRETGEVHDWMANWGIFASEEGYAGAFVRALKPGDGSVISFGNPGTRAACVFTCPDGDATR